MNIKKSILLIILCIINGIQAHAKENLARNVLIYGVVKPRKMSTTVAIGQGLVNQIFHNIGDSINIGEPLIQIFERDTVRKYNGTLEGRIAKLHVTQGAAISPGMPLITVVNDKELYLEFSLSPQQAKELKKGSSLSLYKKRDNSTLRSKELTPEQSISIGVLEKISPIVDPETGSILALSGNIKSSDFFIGQVIPVSVNVGVESCDVVCSLNEVNRYAGEFQVAFISDEKVCLRNLKK